MARPRVRPLITVHCHYCGAELVRFIDKKRNRLGRYYCNRACYESYLLIRPSDEVYHEYSKNDLITELHRVASLVGHIPTSTEMRQQGKIHLSCYTSHFGSWENVKKEMGWTSRYLTFNVKDVSPEDGSWLAGLIDGEGCFHVQRPVSSSCNGKSKSYATRFTMSLRTDDEPMLQEFQRIMGVNQWVHIDNRQSSIAKGMKANPAYKITISDVPTLYLQLMPVLEKYPLRSKKQYEVPVFKLALIILFNKRSMGYRNFSYTESERDILDRIYLCLKELKIFNSDKAQVIAKFGLTDYLQNPQKIEELVHGNRSIAGTQVET